jgi:hypothetical protein
MSKDLREIRTASGYITHQALMKKLIKKRRLDITVQVAIAESNDVYFVLEGTRQELWKFAQKFGFKLVEDGESIYLIAKGE